MNDINSVVGFLLLFLLFATAIIGLTIVIILWLSKMDILFPEIPEGAIIAIKRGDSMENIFCKVEGSILEASTEYPHGCIRPLTEEELLQRRIEEDSPEIKQPLSDCSLKGNHNTIQEMLFEMFGVVFIPWPICTVHKLEIYKNRMRKVLDPSKSDYANRVIEFAAGATIVRQLRHRFEIPVAVTDMELPGDGSRVNVTVVVVCKVRIPYITIFLMPSFQRVIEAVVQLATQNFFSTYKDRKSPKGLTYSDFLSLDKGPGSKLTESILSLNDRNPASSSATGGLRDITGIDIVSVLVEKPDASAVSEGLALALQAEQQAEQEAKGVIAKARGEARAIEMIAQANATRFEAVVRKLVAAGVTADQAAILARETDVASSIKDSSVTVYTPSSGGAGPPVIVDSRPSQGPKEPVQKAKK